MTCANATTPPSGAGSPTTGSGTGDTGNHPGYSLATWLRDYKEQAFLFTRDFAVDWTNNVSERGAKAAKRHQAVSGYWHSLATLARWCRLRSYLDSAVAHAVTALNAVRAAIEGKPWLPPLPAIS
jgi:transposase